MRFKRTKNPVFKLDADERVVLKDFIEYLHYRIYDSDNLNFCVKLEDADYDLLTELRDILRFFE